MVSEFGKILIYLIVGVVILMILLGVSSLIAPRHPNKEKNNTYECGEPSVGNAWLTINAKYYIVALIFLLFEVEIIFILPWAVIFGDAHIIQQYPNWGWLMLGEMFVFVGILLLGLLYVWKNGYLKWQAPLLKSENKAVIPISVYKYLNEEKYLIKKFTVDIVPTDETPVLDDTPNTTVNIPSFRPKFKKPSN